MMKGNAARVKKLKEDILEGPIIKTLLLLGWPVMISNALQMLYNLADTFWLGKIGKEAVAAPTVGFSVVFLMISLGFGLSIAGVSLVSQHIGAGSSRNANKAAGQVISFMFFCSIAISAIGYFIAPATLTTLMAVPDEVFPKALNYIRILFAGLPLMFVFFGFRSLTRGTGDMITPMILTGSSVVANMVLDPILIFGLWGLPALEVAGAAIATVVSRGLAAIAAAYLLFSGKLEIKLRLKDLALKLRWIKQIIRIGLPSAIGQVGTAIGFVLLMGMVSRLGVVAVSAFGIGQRIVGVVNIATWGLASPLTTMIGQNIGAKKQSRALAVAKRAYVLSFSVLAVMALAIFTWKRFLFRIFIEDPAVIETGARFITIFVWSIPFFGLFVLTSSVFRGSGHTRPPMAMSLIRLLVLRVGLSYVLAFGIAGLALGEDGIWLGLFFSNLLGGIMAFGWFLTGSWKTSTIEEVSTEDAVSKEIKKSTSPTR